MTYDPGPYHRRLLTALMEVMSDDTHRWLLEQMGGRKARPLEAVNVWAVEAEGSFERFTDEDCWVVPEKETE